jgi:hypothetical protein
VRLPVTLAQLQARLAAPAFGLTAGEDTYGIPTPG